LAAKLTLCNILMGDWMMKKITTHACLIAAATLLVMSSAQAQSAATSGGYMFAAAGRSDYNDDCTGLAKCKTNGTAFKLGGGYRFGAGLAGEVVFMDFGKETASDSGIDISIKARAIGGGAALHADLGSGFSGVLRLGLASVKMTGKGSLGSISTSTSDSSVQPYFGIGVAYAFTPSLKLEAAWDSTRGKLEGETGNVSALTVGLAYSF
jgi:predicted porin